MEPNISRIFMLPTVVSTPVEDLINIGLVNTYLRDGERDIQYENSLHLLFKPKNTDKFTWWLDREYQNNPAIIDDYNYSGEYIIVVYKLNPSFEKDFQLVKEGKYSKTSPEFRKLFPKVIKIVKNGRHFDELSLQYRIFNKTNDLVEYWENEFNVSFGDEMEVWRKMNEEEETISHKKLKEYA